jgi:hypothetical protein
MFRASSIMIINRIDLPRLDFDVHKAIKKPLAVRANIARDVSLAWHGSTAG